MTSGVDGPSPVVLKPQTKAKMRKLRSNRVTSASTNTVPEMRQTLKSVSCISNRIIKRHSGKEALLQPIVPPDRLYSVTPLSLQRTKESWVSSAEIITHSGSQTSIDWRCNRHLQLEPSGADFEEWRILRWILCSTLWNAKTVASSWPRSTRREVYHSVASNDTFLNSNSFTLISSLSTPLVTPNLALPNRYGRS